MNERIYISLGCFLIYCFDLVTLNNKLFASIFDITDVLKWFVADEASPNASYSIGIQEIRSENESNFSGFWIEQ